jgi:hypothetical protein
MPLNLILLTLHRLASHFYKLGRHASGDALRVVSVDGQLPTHQKRVDDHAYFSSTFVRLTLEGYYHGVMMRSSLGLT